MSVSTELNIAHIARVAQLLGDVRRELKCRAAKHDRSKLRSPEVEVFEEFTPKLKGVTFGGPEYNGFLDAMKPALEHHYEFNRHHPQHFAHGVTDMNLIDIIEMFVDWKAATERHDDGSMEKSYKVNGPRFNISQQVIEIFRNTEAMMRTW